MTAAVLKSTAAAIVIGRTDPSLPIFTVNDRRAIAVRAGTSIAIGAGSAVDFNEETAVALPELVAGSDYYVGLNAMNEPVAIVADGLPGIEVVGGFHFAPGGNAMARSGGDSEPAINLWSCWDVDFRPACSDPRGMALVDLADGGRVWVDIYKLGVDHVDQGTSRFGVTIADGRDLPRKPGGDSYRKLDYQTAVEIYAHHGKQLLSYDEFRAAAFGATEKAVAPRDPKTTGLDAGRTSQWGIMQATGNLWDWGHDDDPDTPRASIFGGSWIGGDNAGSRCAGLGYWPGNSNVLISARGRSDHLAPA